MTFLYVNDIRDKIEALNGDNTQLISVWDVVLWASIGLLSVVLCFLFCRLFLKGKERYGSFGFERRFGRKSGSSDQDLETGDGQPGVADDEAMAAPVLHETAPDSRVVVFWDVDGVRHRLPGYVAAAEGETITVRFDSEGAPSEGGAFLVTTDEHDHALLYEVTSQPGENELSRNLVSDSALSPVRIRKDPHFHMAVTAAAIIGDSDSAEAVAVRVHDMALDGVGLLSEEPMEENDRLVLRFDLAGYHDRLTLEGRVSWSELDIAGIHRAGLRLEFADDAERLILAEYVLASRRGEASPSIVEQDVQADAPSEPVGTPTA